MSDDLAQIQAAINSATYRLDELEKAQSAPANKQADEQQALLNKVKVLEVALERDLKKGLDSIVNKSQENKSALEKLIKEFAENNLQTSHQITELRNDLNNVQTMVNDILRELRDEIKQTVTKEYISELYKKGGE